MIDNQESNIDKIKNWLNDCQTIRSNEPDNVLSQMLSLFGKHFEMVQGIAFIKNKENKKYDQIATYAFIFEEKLSFEEGEGIIGQAVKDKKLTTIKDIPIKYFTALSGLGSSNKLELLIIPLNQNDVVEAVIEMAFFKLPNENILKEIERTVIDCYFNKVNVK